MISNLYLGNGWKSPFPSILKLVVSGSRQVTNGDSNFSFSREWCRWGTFFLFVAEWLLLDAFGMQSDWFIYYSLVIVHHHHHHHHDHHHHPPPLPSHFQKSHIFDFLNPKQSYQIPRFGFMTITWCWYQSFYVKLSLIAILASWHRTQKPMSKLIGNAHTLGFYMGLYIWFSSKNKVTFFARVLFIRNGWMSE